jgi:nicotinamidase/pyrazinamidase
VKRALILVDLQNDFMPGGALAVKDGDQVIPVANRLQRCFELVIATQDWHPANHGSFAKNHPGCQVGETIELDGVSQVLWPVHCVQQSRGAAIVSSLDRSRIRKIFHKGTDPEIDSYSAFFDNEHLQSTGLGEYLKENGTGEVYLMGLATDYCVRYSALDARILGFETTVVEDGCRGVELTSGDIDRAVEEMKAAGVRFCSSSRIETD